jgi:hypothetical protein
MFLTCMQFEQDLQAHALGYKNISYQELRKQLNYNDIQSFGLCYFKIIKKDHATLAGSGRILIQEKGYRWTN